MTKAPYKSAENYCVGKEKINCNTAEPCVKTMDDVLKGTDYRPQGKHLLAA